ncbi:hypothetical protein CVT24_005135 [Panaeolus cyanescens]|uniref:Tail specific protease domain-containing protein n=1 Tax=Panaeolus cyanescens TaxID=181874 RepID=A0A409V9R0_9AGAR|nr:hypothetical protein CVT24_005135 [Panaeolus cyanescens]
MQQPQRKGSAGPNLLTSLLTVVLLVTQTTSNPLPDPCADIAGKKWVTPAQVRACFTSFPVDPKVKANVIEVVNKTLPFHTSVNYQIQAPPPFEHDVHEDLVADLLRISNQTHSSDFEFHLDMYRSFKRVNDGHCGVYNYCYDSLYVTYIPLPLVLVTNENGGQDVHIAPEAFAVASTEFQEQMSVWQSDLPYPLRGQLESLSGAKVHLIDGEEPFVAVNKNAETTGGYQSFGTRQNSFFASYHSGVRGWEYYMGNFAQQVHPLTDSVELTIPYYSRFGSASKPFTDSKSYRANNCVATNKTNGQDYYSGNFNLDAYQQSLPPIATFQQQPTLRPDEYHKYPMNVLLDGLPPTDIVLPEHLHPRTPPLNSSYSVGKFYVLDDKVTGVLALGSFSAQNFTTFGKSLLKGLNELKEKGAKQLIVDVTNNGGGYICIAHWLHRIIVGPSETTVPQAGLDSVIRAGPLAQLIVKSIAQGMDPLELLSYNPKQWTNATHHQFPAAANWIKPYPIEINGHQDAFSQRLGQECQPFDWDAPDEVLSNSIKSETNTPDKITMSKREGVRTVVVGGKVDTVQEYCGTVGGQSTSFSMIDSEIKSTKLKTHQLAPPDFLTNSVQGITWRLGLGIDNIDEPEEWQEHSADINFPLTMQTVNNPMAIWKALADKYLSHNHHTPAFQLQDLDQPW